MLVTPATESVPAYAGATVPAYGDCEGLSPLLSELESHELQRELDDTAVLQRLE